MDKFTLIFLLPLLLFITNCTDSSNKDRSYSTGIDYPIRDITLIIPFGKGSASDFFVRNFAAILSDKIPVTIQPINKKGAGGLLGMIYASRLSSDGYTILEITPSHIISDVLKRSKSVSLLKNFEPLALVQTDQYVLLRKNDGSSKNFKDILQEHERPITVAGISPRGLDEITLKALAKSIHKKLKFIPYKSGYDVRAAVLSGEIDMYLGKLISTIKYIRSGKFHPLLVLSDKRLDIPELANIPSSVELGYNVTVKSWRGFAIKSGTPKYIKDYLLERMRYSYQSEAYQVFAAKYTTCEQRFMEPEEFFTFLESEFRFFNKLISEDSKN